jgi:hypothetical protein
MTCVINCPVYLYGDASDPNDPVCNTNCPLGWYTDNTTWTCVTLCPNSYYKQNTK